MSCTKRKYLIFALFLILLNLLQNTESRTLYKRRRQQNVLNINTTTVPRKHFRPHLASRLRHKVLRPLNLSKTMPKRRQEFYAYNEPVRREYFAEERHGNAQSHESSHFAQVPPTLIPTQLNQLGSIPQQDYPYDLDNDRRIKQLMEELVLKSRMVGKEDILASPPTALIAADEPVITARTKPLDDDVKENHDNAISSQAAIKSKIKNSIKTNQTTEIASHTSTPSSTLTANKNEFQQNNKMNDKMLDQFLNNALANFQRKQHINESPSTSTNIAENENNFAQLKQHNYEPNKLDSFATMDMQSSRKNNDAAIDLIENNKHYVDTMANLNSMEYAAELPSKDSEEYEILENEGESNEIVNEQNKESLMQEAANDVINTRPNLMAIKDSSELLTSSMNGIASKTSQTTNINAALAASKGGNMNMAYVTKPSKQTFMENQSKMADNELTKAAEEIAKTSNFTKEKVVQEQAAEVAQKSIIKQTMDFTPLESKTYLETNTTTMPNNENILMKTMMEEEELMQQSKKTQHNKSNQSIDLRKTANVVDLQLKSNKPSVINTNALLENDFKHNKTIENSKNEVAVENKALQSNNTLSNQNATNAVFNTAAKLSDKSAQSSKHNDDFRSNKPQIQLSIIPATLQTKVVALNVTKPASSESFVMKLQAENAANDTVLTKDDVNDANTDNDKLLIKSQGVVIKKVEKLVHGIKVPKPPHFNKETDIDNFSNRFDNSSDYQKEVQIRLSSPNNSASVTKNNNKKADVNKIEPLNSNSNEQMVVQSFINNGKAGIHYPEKSTSQESIKNASRNVDKKDATIPQNNNKVFEIKAALNKMAYFDPIIAEKRTTISQNSATLAQTNSSIPEVKAALDEIAHLESITHKNNALISQNTAIVAQNNSKATKAEDMTELESIIEGKSTAIPQNSDTLPLDSTRISEVNDALENMTHLESKTGETSTEKFRNRGTISQNNIKVTEARETQDDNMAHLETIIGDFIEHELEKLDSIQNDTDKADSSSTSNEKVNDTAQQVKEQPLAIHEDISLTINCHTKENSTDNEPYANELINQTNKTKETHNQKIEILPATLIFPNESMNDNETPLSLLSNQKTDEPKTKAILKANKTAAAVAADADTIQLDAITKSDEYVANDKHAEAVVDSPSNAFDTSDNEDDEDDVDERDKYEDEENYDDMTITTNDESQQLLMDIVATKNENDKTYAIEKDKHNSEDDDDDDEDDDDEDDKRIIGQMENGVDTATTTTTSTTTTPIVDNKLLKADQQQKLTQPDNEKLPEYTSDADKELAGLKSTIAAGYNGNDDGVRLNTAETLLGASTKIEIDDSNEENSIADENDDDQDDDQDDNQDDDQDDNVDDTADNAIAIVIDSEEDNDTKMPTLVSLYQAPQTTMKNSDDTKTTTHDKMEMENIMKNVTKEMYKTNEMNRISIAEKNQSAIATYDTKTESVDAFITNTTTTTTTIAPTAVEATSIAAATATGIPTSTPTSINSDAILSMSSSLPSNHSNDKEVEVDLPGSIAAQKYDVDEESQHTATTTKPNGGSEITTTNWWHTLSYTEIRKFLNTIFDSETADELYTEIARKSKEIRNGQQLKDIEQLADDADTVDDGKTVNGGESLWDITLSNLWNTLW